MDRLNQYREIIEAILTEHAKVPYANSPIQTTTAFDRQQDHYLLIDAGWDGERYVHHCLVHVDIINGKFWIHYDGTEDGIATDLEEAGVPKDHIVLAFRPPDLRQYTEYAAA